MREHACWRDPLPAGRLPRGRGLALGYWRGTSMTSAGHITIAGDGRPMVTMGAVDLSGTRTTMAQVVAEEFGLTVEDIHIHTGDSQVGRLQRWRSRKPRRAHHDGGAR